MTQEHKKIIEQHFKMGADDKEKNVSAALKW